MYSADGNYRASAGSCHFPMKVATSGRHLKARGPTPVAALLGASGECVHVCVESLHDQSAPPSLALLPRDRLWRHCPCERQNKNCYSMVATGRYSDRQTWHVPAGGWWAHASLGTYAPTPRVSWRLPTSCNNIIAPRTTVRLSMLWKWGSLSRCRSGGRTNGCGLATFNIYCERAAYVSFVGEGQAAVVRGNDG
jgi:hypothetical protein